MKIVSWIFLLSLFLNSCSKKYLLIPPSPESRLSITKELTYIENTDQTDRKKGFFAIITNSKKGKLIYKRDSIRAGRVYQLYSSDSIKKDNDKFAAGLVLFHSNYLSYNKLAYAIFEDLEENGKTTGAKLNGENWKQLVYKHTLKP